MQATKRRFIAIRAFVYEDAPISFENLGLIEAKDYTEAIANEIFQKPVADADQGYKERNDWAIEVPVHPVIDAWDKEMLTEDCAPIISIGYNEQSGVHVFIDHKISPALASDILNKASVAILQTTEERDSPEDNS